MIIHNESGLPTIDFRTAKPLQGNLKDLSKDNHDKLLKVLNKRGFTTPLFVWCSPKKLSALDAEQIEADTLYLMDGHQRSRVMLANDLNDNGSYEVPYVLVPAKNLKEAKEQLLEITSQYGHMTVEGLDEFAFDLDLSELDINFDAIDMDKLIDSMSDDVEEDEAPEVDEVNPPVSALGEVYQLGVHRLMCGDATSLEAVKELLAGNKADALITDPPYNFENEGGGHFGKQFERAGERVKDIVDFDPYSMAFLKEAGIASSFYFFMNKALVKDYLNVFDGMSYNILAWEKSDAPPMVNNNFVSDIEYVLYFHSKGRVWNNGLDVENYRKVYRSSMNEGRKEGDDAHPTIKPLGILMRYIRISTKTSVLDLFGGSGSTLIAADKMKRTCYMMELDPKYIDVIRKRYSNLIGAEDWQSATPVIELATV